MNSLPATATASAAARTTTAATAATVSAGLAGALRVAGEDDLLLPVLVRWSETDPEVLRLVLLLDADEADGAPEWVIARSHVQAGMAAPSRDGAVLVQVTGRQLAITVGAGRTAATLLLPLADIAQLLGASYNAVPTGAESRVLLDLPRL